MTDEEQNLTQDKPVGGVWEKMLIVEVTLTGPSPTQTGSKGTPKGDSYDKSENSWSSEII